LNNLIKNQIIDLANSSDTEVCGFIYLTGNDAKLYPCENISVLDKISNFEISAHDYIECNKLGKIYGIYHSHVIHDSNFSGLDVEVSEECAMPIFVYSKLDKEFNEYYPESYFPDDLIGRNFVWGFSDCYELVRDFYKTKLKIKLPNYDRLDSFDKFNFHFVLTEPEKIGFKKVDIEKVKFGDLLVFDGSHGNSIHLGVYSGEGKMTHQTMNGISREEEIGQWALKLRGAYRYE